MAQNLTTDITGQTGAQWVSSFNGSISALASSMSGASAPGTTNAGMPWFDTTTNQWKIRNAANTAWIPVMRYLEKVDERAWSAAAFSTFIQPPVRSATIEEVRIVSTTATTGSSAGVTDYVFDVYNVTDSHSLFSATQTTGTTEITANTVYTLTPDQNNTITADDVLEFRVTVNGSPTSLTRVAVYISWIWLVD